MIAEVAVSCAIFAIDQPYSYRIPQGMQILPGMRVVVPFGRANRRTEAIVLGVQTGSEDKLKAIEQLLDDAPVMTDEQLRLAAFVRERYFCTYYDAVKAILPAGLWFRQEKIYRIREDASDWRDTCRGRETECFVMQLLEDFGASAPETALLNQMEDRQQAQAAIGWLLSKKLIENDLELTQKPGARKQKFAAIAAPEEAARYAEKKKRTAPVQAAVLELLGAAGECACRELTELTGATASTFSRLEKLGLITIWEQEVQPELLSPAQEAAQPPRALTPQRHGDGRSLRKILQADAECNADCTHDRLRRRAALECPKGHADSQPLRDIVQCDREDEQNDTVRPVPPLRSAADTCDHAVRCPEEDGSKQKAQCGNEPRRQAVLLCRAGNGGLQQGPEARRDHDPCRKAEHAVHCFRRRPAEQEHRCRARSRHSPCPERRDQCPNDWMIHIPPPVSIVCSRGGFA